MTRMRSGSAAMSASSVTGFMPVQPTSLATSTAPSASISTSAPDSLPNR